MDTKYEIKNEIIYEIGIIGSGPSACSSAIYGGMAGRSVIMLAGYQSGGQIITTYKVKNYLGFNDISGIDLANNYLDHAQEYATIKYEYVLHIIQQNDIFILVTNEENTYKCKSIIIATGSSHRKISQTNEHIEYCAICDGFFYKNKIVAVLGGGNSAFESIEYLDKLCPKIYSIHRSDKYRAFETSVNKWKNSSKVEFIQHATIENIISENDQLLVEYQQHNEIKSIIVDALFVCIGMIPNTSFLKTKNIENQIIMGNEFNQIACDDNGNIIVNKNYMTSVPGIFASGDVITHNLMARSNQAIVAAAEGCIAVLQLIDYLNHIISTPIKKIQNNNNNKKNKSRQ